MRRNSATLLKYLLFAALFLVLGPMALKLFFGHKNSVSDVNQMNQQIDKGLPVPPGADLKLPADMVKLKERENDGDVQPKIRKDHEVDQAIKKKTIKKQKKQKDLFKDSIRGEAVEKNYKEVPDALGLVDWHNYQKMEQEKQRVGPGEQGAAVILSAGEESKKHELYKVNGFNAYVSDKISMDRALKDIRNPGCKSQKYLAELPTASVIIPFHNEHWSTLLRSAHSVINRSPKHLIHEVILVDDFSSKEHCKEKLDEYVKTHFTNVRVVRAKKREGLIRTRLLGAKAAKGDVLIFLDSHVEATTNWLPPLLDPIARDHKTVVCPFIDVIDYETFAYRAQDEGARGAFDWEFFYKRLPLLPEDLKHPEKPFKSQPSEDGVNYSHVHEEPVAKGFTRSAYFLQAMANGHSFTIARSPVMAGGLFAIHKDWFWDLGGYDPGLDIWGGEQYELSFKLWQCGGMMVDASCSRVGHVYRKFAPFPNPGVGDFVGRNYKRVAEVWMDEYKEYLYNRRPHYRNIDAGDLSAQIAIRTKLKCKSFKWFMTEVAFDLIKHYPPVEPPNMAEGELRNIGSNMCVDTRYKGQNERFGLEKCIRDGTGLGGEQNFELTWHKDIRPRKRSVCFDVSTSIMKAPVILYNCHGMQGNQHFKYNLNTKQLLHPVSGQCMDCDMERHEIFMSPCNQNSESQKWKFMKMNEKEVKKEWARRR